MHTASVASVSDQTTSSSKVLPVGLWTAQGCSLRRLPASGSYESQRALQSTHTPGADAVWVAGSPGGLVRSIGVAELFFGAIGAQCCRH